MIKVLNYIGRDTVRTFTLERAQPVKDPLFMLYPVKGVLEVRSLGGASLAKKKITVRSYKELKKVLHQSAS
ncbi:MAG: hypothetical protein K6T29_04425 [Peptococcaceae bacterium]|nr:hypothetical protein [Peptococcaceae bacterium]